MNIIQHSFAEATNRMQPEWEAVAFNWRQQHDYTWVTRLIDLERGFLSLDQTLLALHKVSFLVISETALRNLDLSEPRKL